MDGPSLEAPLDAAAVVKIALFFAALLALPIVVALAHLIADRIKKRKKLR